MLLAKSNFNDFIFSVSLQSFVDTVLNDLLDIHVLGEWKNTHATIPSHIDISQNNEKISSSFSRNSVGMVLIELGKNRKLYK